MITSKEKIKRFYFAIVEGKAHKIDTIKISPNIWKYIEGIKDVNAEVKYMEDVCLLDNAIQIHYKDGSFQRVDIDLDTRETTYFKLITPQRITESKDVFGE